MNSQMPGQCSDLLSPKTKRQTKMKTRMTAAAVGALCAGDMENFIAAATPGGIEAQEKRGQIEQSFLETLPIKGTSSEADRKVWEALGFKFKLDRTAAQNQGRDEIFVECEFPKGWRKKVTDHEIASADCAPARGSAATHEPDTTLVRITLKGRRWKIIRTALWPGNKAITVRLRKANMNFDAKPPNSD